MKRIRSIDITRGLVMVIMALDHVREYFHITSGSDPLNLANTTAALFFTRWITHLCAPSFVFLAGVSAYVSMKKRNNPAFTRKFLLTRGIWLVFLEFTLINFALWFDIGFRLLILEVIGAIGISFIVLSFLISLGSRITGIIGIILIFSHDLLTGLNLEGSSSFLFNILFRPGMTQLTTGTAFFAAYPVIPWLGIMLTGFACGEFFTSSQERRKKIFLQSGLFCIFLFIAIRFANYYGDPSPWIKQEKPFFTFLSFINVSKYPPSLLFTLLFTGLTFIMLFISETVENRISGFLSVYGKVPFFYFVVHLYLIHALMFAMLFLQGYGTKDLVFGPFMNGRPREGGGLGLAGTYLVWIGVVAVMYPLSLWYGRMKEKNRGLMILRYI